MLLNILNKHEGIQEFRSFICFPGSLVLESQGMLGSVSSAGKAALPAAPCFIGYFQMISTYAGVQLRGHGASALLVLHAGVGILPLLAPADLCGRQEEGEGQLFLFDKCCATV